MSVNMPSVLQILIASIGLFSLAWTWPTASWADPTNQINKRATDSMILPPSKDPWYTTPDDFEHARPGDVLRIRAAPGNLTVITSNCSAIYNILYRTTNSQYKPAWAVTTLFIPKHPVKALLSYQVPYDSADVDASPSYAMNANVPPEVNSSLSKGWFVSVPDYEGPLASFTAGVMSGHATIDSIRAIFSKKHEFGLTDDARYAMWGYSGGALASEWAAELQVQYAPELSFSGAALGGLTPNVTSVLETINKGYAAGLAPVSKPIRESGMRRQSLYFRIKPHFGPSHRYFPEKTDPPFVRAPF